MKGKWRKNAVPKRYRAYFIEPGIADYTADGQGILLVQKPVLDKMNPTFVGMPVINMVHTDKEPEELFNLEDDEIKDFADGVVAATGYDDESGWYWADMMIWDEETIQNIDEFGFSVSCAYDIVKVSNDGGTWHAAPYDAELLDGKYMHMAVVPNPRYEGARIVTNSKPNDFTEGETVKIKFFKQKDKVANMDPPKQEELTEEVENMSGVVELEDGTQVPLEEVIAAYKAKKNADDEAKVYGPDDIVEIDGEKVKVSDLLNCYSTKANAEAPTDVEAEEVVDETAQVSNASPQPKKVQKNDNFKKVENAANQDGGTQFEKPNSRSERLARGKQRYTKAVAGGEK